MHIFGKNCWFSGASTYQFCSGARPRDLCNCGLQYSVGPRNNTTHVQFQRQCQIKTLIYTDQNGSHQFDMYNINERQLTEPCTMYMVQLSSALRSCDHTTPSIWQASLTTTGWIWLKGTTNKGPREGATNQGPREGTANQGTRGGATNLEVGWAYDDDTCILHEYLTQCED